jgi:hypothetical protein
MDGSSLGKRNKYQFTKAKKHRSVTLDSKASLEFLILDVSTIQKLISDLVSNAELWDSGIKDLSKKGRILTKVKKWLIEEKSLDRKGMYKIIPKSKFDSIAKYLTKFSKSFKKVLFSLGTSAKNSIKNVSKIPFLGIIVTCIDTSYEAVINIIKKESAAKVLAGVVTNLSKALVITGGSLAITTAIVAGASALSSAMITSGTISMASMGMGAVIGAAALPGTIVIAFAVVIGIGVTYSVEYLYNKYNIEKRIENLITTKIEELEETKRSFWRWTEFLNSFEGINWMMRRLSGPL